MPAKKKTKLTKTAATYKNELGLPLTDPAEIAQDICWTAWDIDSSTVRGKKERERLVKEALQYDENCTDAYCILASESSNAEDKLRYALKAKESFESTHDASYFKENEGIFYGVLETRPYMRALWYYADALCDIDKNNAAETMQYMLRLCPNDNLGIRYRLINLFIAMKDFVAARKLLKAHPDDAGVEMIYGALLLLFAENNSDKKTIARAYKKAKERNPFVPAYLLGKKIVSGEENEYIAMGSEDEAALYACDNKILWEQFPTALDFLKEADRESL
ncbi:MAG: hypothetical protein ACFNLN_05865 [Treponema socranskii subsp. buccale]